MPLSLPQGRTRAEAAAAHISALNPHVRVSVQALKAGRRDGRDTDTGTASDRRSSDDDTGEDTDDAAAAAAAAALVAGGAPWSVVVAVDQPIRTQVALNNAARATGSLEATGSGAHMEARGEARGGVACGAAFVACGARGVFGHVFCDFGPGFVVRGD